MILLTATFVLVAWHFTLDRSATKIRLSASSLVTYAIGGILTAVFSHLVGLSPIFDASGFVLGWMAVDYFVDSKIVDYSLPDPDEITKQLKALGEQKAEVEVLLADGQVAEDTANHRLASINNHITILLRAQSWYQEGYKRFDEIQASLKAFEQHLDSIESRCQSLGCHISRGGVSFELNDRVIHLFRVGEMKWKMNESLLEGDLDQLRTFLACFTRNRSHRMGPALKFPGSYFKASMVAIVTSELRNQTGPITQEFDRVTLSVLGVAQMEYVQRLIMHQRLRSTLRDVPSGTIARLLIEDYEGLLGSIRTVRDMLENRIAMYLQLEKSEPESYVVKQFHRLRGLLGLSAVSSSIRTLDRQELELSHQEEEMQSLAGRIELQCPS